MSKKTIRNKILLPLSIGLALTLTACTTDQINGGIGAVMTAGRGLNVTEAELIESSKLSAKAMDKKNRVASRKSKYSKRLNKLTRKLKHHAGLNFNFKVYKSKTINAFAMPDGTVRVYSGLMDKFNDDELVSVIGHEIGHVINKHSLKQYKKSFIAKAAKEGLTAAGGTVGALAGSYGDIAEDFLNAQFSQSDELESDLYGVKLLHDLGRDPYAAASAQRKLQQLGGGKDSMFSSHPSSKKRIARAVKEADRLTGKK